MGTVPELRELIDRGLTIGLLKFGNDYKNKMEKDAQKSEDKYYKDYSSWYDPYRRFDIKNMHEVDYLYASRETLIIANFSSSHMQGGHGIWKPLSDYAPDPGQVFTWGFETGNHGWYVRGTPVRTYWEQYFRARKQHAKSQALKTIIAGLNSVGL